MAAGFSRIRQNSKISRIRGDAVVDPEILAAHQPLEAQVLGLVVDRDPAPAAARDQMPMARWEQDARRAFGIGDAGGEG